MNGRYGEAPQLVGRVALPRWQEFMHYLYLPVRIPRSDSGMGGGPWPLSAIPPRLEFLAGLIGVAVDDAQQSAPWLDDPYVYVTARRGYATPGNPLNRPGWHCDDFGGTDLNYIWCDAYPTRFLLSDQRLAIPLDDAQSMVAMARAVEFMAYHPDRRIVEAPLGALLRLTPYVIHDTPIIPAPGGMRSFLKISVSTHRYNLVGNSRNHLLDYDWPMVDRAALRNQPAGANRDYVLP